MEFGKSALRYLWWWWWLCGPWICCPLLVGKRKNKFPAARYWDCKLPCVRRREDPTPILALALVNCSAQFLWCRQLLVCAASKSAQVSLRPGVKGMWAFIPTVMYPHSYLPCAYYAPGTKQGDGVEQWMGRPCGRTGEFFRLTTSIACVLDLPFDLNTLLSEYESQRLLSSYCIQHLFFSHLSRSQMLFSKGTLSFGHKWPPWVHIIFTVSRTLISLSCAGI